MEQYDQDFASLVDFYRQSLQEEGRTFRSPEELEAVAHSLAENEILQPQAVQSNAGSGRSGQAQAFSTGVLDTLNNTPGVGHALRAGPNLINQHFGGGQSLSRDPREEFANANRESAQAYPNTNFAGNSAERYFMDEGIAEHEERQRRLDRIREYQAQYLPGGGDTYAGGEQELSSNPFTKAAAR